MTPRNPTDRLRMHGPVRSMDEKRGRLGIALWCLSAAVVLGVIAVLLGAGL